MSPPKKGCTQIEGGYVTESERQQVTITDLASQKKDSIEPKDARCDGNAIRKGLEEVSTRAEDLNKAPTPSTDDEVPKVGLKQVETIPKDQIHVRQDNANHIFMLQAQIQTLHRQMEERTSQAPKYDPENLRQTFEACARAWMDDSDRKLNADVATELASFRAELRSMQDHQDREMEEIRQFISHEFDMMQQKIQQCIAISTEDRARRHYETERALQPKEDDASFERYAQLEAKLEDLEGAFDHVEELRRQLTSQQKLLQSCQRHLREIQRDRDDCKEKPKAQRMSETFSEAALISEQQQEHSSSITAKAQTRLSEKRQQSLKFHQTLNHLKIMTEGTEQELKSSQGKREVISKGKKFREPWKFEKRNPANYI